MRQDGGSRHNQGVHRPHRPECQSEIRMKLLRLALAVTIAAAWAAPAAAQRYTAKQDGDARRTRRHHRADERVRRLEHEQRVAHPGERARTWCGPRPTLADFQARPGLERHAVARAVRQPPRRDRVLRQRQEVQLRPRAGQRARADSRRPATSTARRPGSWSRPRPTARARG